MGDGILCEVTFSSPQQVGHSCSSGKMRLQFLCLSSSGNIATCQHAYAQERSLVRQNRCLTSFCQCGKRLLLYGNQLALRLHSITDKTSLLRSWCQASWNAADARGLLKTTPLRPVHVLCTTSTPSKFDTTRRWRRSRPLLCLRRSTIALARSSCVSPSDLCKV